MTASMHVSIAAARPAPARGLAAMLAATVLAAGCAGVPVERPRDAGPASVPESAPPTPPAAPAAVTSVEAVWRTRAEALVRERRWADAAVQWELLALLRPDVAAYQAQAADTRRRATEVAAERVRAGNEARQRGDVEQAATQYLRALAADPLNAGAADGLREIERERVRRAYLNRGPRGLAPGPMAAGAAPSSAPASPPAPVPRTLPRQPVPEALSDVDTGVLLFKQGDFLGAIQTLQRHLQTHRTDELARGYLADAYLQQGGRYAQEGRREDALFYYERAQTAGYRDRGTVQALIRSTRQALGEEYYRLGVQVAATDPKRAMFLWERSLVYDPQHAQAASRLKQSRPAVPVAPTATAAPGAAAQSSAASAVKGQ